MSQITSREIWDSFRMGVYVALAVSPFANLGNLVSVYCGENRGHSSWEALRRIYCGAVAKHLSLERPSIKNFSSTVNLAFLFSTKRGIPMQDALLGIYRGTVMPPVHPSLWHLGRGWGPYFSREATRCLFKPFGAQFIRPAVERHFNTDADPSMRMRANSVFALIMALCDTSLTPIDAARVRLQAGLSAIPSVEEAKGRNRLGMMSQGALANIARQWSIFYIWAVTQRPSTQMMQDHFRIDPTSAAGLVLRSGMQAIPITLVSFPFERIKNCLQVNPYEGKGRRNWETLKMVVRQRSIYTGIGPKVFGMWPLVFGFNLLVDLGNKRRTT